jgi:carbon storage regulator
MLVLSRQRDESVVINDDIEVRVVDVRGDKVRLGFVAPRTVSIHRKEIYEAIRRENALASQLRPGDVPPLSGPRPVSGHVLFEPDRPMLDVAIDEANRSREEGGLPLGCVLASDGRLLARAHDRRRQDGRRNHEAALLALEQAEEALPAETTAYLTSIPSMTSAAALVEAGVARVVVGTARRAITTHARGPGAADLLRFAGVALIDLHDDRCVRLLEPTET